MSRKLTGRAVDGILLLDKPAGISSNAVLQQARRLFMAQKAGHTGSLDPLACGLLPVCFGEATKVSGCLLDSDKHYRVTVHLGRQTDTGDAEGRVLAEMDWAQVDAARIEAAFARMLGPQQQRPPMYSALKHQGRRLYALARQGIEVERAPRPIEIQALQLLRLEGAELEFEVRCSKGTYVRTLVEDLARLLGTCAHVAALRRLAAGPFAGPMYSLEELVTRAADGLAALDACLLPPVAAVAGWPRIVLDEPSAYRLSRGQAVTVPKSPAQGEVAVFDAAGRLLGMGTVQGDGRIAPRRLLNYPKT